MALRSFSQRVHQTLLYEVAGLVLVSPILSLASSASLEASALLIAVLSVEVLTWTPIYNTLFDLAEWRLYARVASDRTQRCRILNAVGHEVSSTIVTLPLIMWFSAVGLVEALVIDVTLTLAYVAYAYMFHRIYDRRYPVIIRPCGNVCPASGPDPDSSN